MGKIKYNYNEYIGKKFGHLTVIKHIENSASFICNCDCGNTVERSIYSLKVKNPECGNCYNGKSYNLFIGFKSGNLTILNIESKTDSTGVNRKYALCECICNNKKYFPFKNIVNGNTKKCGECYNGIPYSSFVGKKYGTLIVKSVYNSKEKLRWVADCECEICRKQSELSLTNLNKYRKCIFCRENESRKKYEYMVGKHFGHIKILKINNELGYDRTITALCKCDCGNFCNISLPYLIRNKRATSCGQCYNGIPYSSFVGKKYGYLTVLDIMSENINGSSQKIALCKCDCGNSCRIIFSPLIKGNTKKCGECYNGIPYSSFVGKKYGYLTVLDIMSENINGSSQKIALCKCDCGNSCRIIFSPLIKGNTKKCGECYNGIPYSSFVGKKYGYLTITKISPAKTNNKKRTTVNCKCDCGKEVDEMEFTSLLCCENISCGCFARQYKFIKQISYGHLNIIRTSKNNLGGLRYICKCDCGNEIEVLESDLFTEKVTSCEECMN